MIRIGLSGTNWTRKTTTIARLLESHEPRQAEVIALSPLVAACPFPMGPDQTLDGSEWMVTHLTEMLDRHPPQSIQIFDRTPLDVFAFTLHAADREQSPTSHRALALYEQVRALGARFDRIFICRPGGEWPSPVTPTDSARLFALRIDQYLTKAAAHWTSPLTELPWESTGRLAELATALDRTDT